MTTICIVQTGGYFNFTKRHLDVNICVVAERICRFWKWTSVGIHSPVWIRFEHVSRNSVRIRWPS
jgi:hypothetical protein